FIADDQTAYVFSFLARRLGTVDLAAVRDGLRYRWDDVYIGVPGPLPSTPESIVGEQVLSDRAALGRALFHAANTASIAWPYAKVSCATCHPGGRTDGLTWTTPEGGRQTPSLAGPISRNGPMLWSGRLQTV